MKHAAAATAEPDDDKRNEGVLERLRAFQRYGTSRFQKNRELGNACMRALSMEGPWPKAELEARKDPNNPRPHGHTDIISQYNNRVVNQARMNPRAVKVIPRGEGATEDTVEKRANRLRAIEYESNADQARLTGLQNAVDRGYGYWRVDTEYASPRSRNLKIVIKRVPNPNSIIDDPDAREADRSDRKKLIACEWTLVEDAMRRFPSMLDPKSFPAETQDACSAFVDKERMLLAEYWEVETTKERVIFYGGQAEGVFESELPEGALGEGVITLNGQQFPIDGEREDGEKKTVWSYFTNGFQVFERRQWPGTTIPFPACFGREKYIEDELEIEALTAKAIEPQFNFDYARANQIESLGQIPKAKWVLSDRAIAGYEEMWKMAHRNPQAYLKYHDLDPENPNSKIEKPIFQDYNPAVEGAELLASAFTRDAQNTIGMVSTERKDRVAKSGIAQERMDEAADIASFHFIDSWLGAIEFEGRIINELLDKIEDSQRTVGFRSEDGKYKQERLEPMEGQPHPYGDSSSHDVTISTGSSWQSQREEVNSFVDNLVATPDATQNPLMPMAIDLKDMGPKGDKMKKVAIAALKQTMPAVAAVYEEDDSQQQMPPEALQAIDEAKKQVEAINAQADALEAQNVELTQKLESKEIENASREKISAEDNAASLEKARMDNEAKLQLEREKMEFQLKLKALEVEIEKFRAQVAIHQQNQNLAANQQESERNREHEAAQASSQEGSAT